MSRAISPFKFLDSYEQKDADIFFGRDNETEALYQALSGVKHLLVHGPSGAGKTSLIECGLRNKFSDADWFALSIRRGQNMTASVFEKINSALRDKVALHPNTKLPMEKEQGQNVDFGQAIDRLFAERFQPVYLLFDQFEELLLLGSEAEKRDFFTRLNELIRYKVPCRVLLVMREEFIGHLSEWEHLCPSIFQNRFRLEKMPPSNVRQVLQNILEAPKYQSAFQVEQPEQLAESILAKLPDAQQEIDLTHVQVFLGELWDRAVAADPKARLPVLHRNLIKKEDNLERVLDSFLKKQMEELTPKHGKKAPLELLAAMISKQHTKLQLSAADLQHHLAKNKVTLLHPLPDLLRDLEEHRILRALRSGELTQYEITHDLLAKVVGDNLTEEIKMRSRALEISNVYKDRQGHLTQDDLNYLRPYAAFLPEQTLQHIAASERELTRRAKAEKDKNRNRLLLLSAFLAAALVGLGVAWVQFGLANNAKDDALAQQQKAVDEKQKADWLLILSEENRIRADTNASKAERQTKLANDNAIEAKRQAEKAKAALAERDRQEAEKDQINFKRLEVAVAAFIKAGYCKQALKAFEDAKALAQKHTELNGFLLELASEVNSCTVN